MPVSRQSKGDSDLPTRIIDLLENSHPLLAREIAAALNKNGGISVTRRLVNQCLYRSVLSEYVRQDSNHRWYIDPDVISNSEHDDLWINEPEVLPDAKAHNEPNIRTQELIPEFIEALDEEIEAIKKGGRGGITKIFNGRLVRELAGIFVYIFNLENFLSVLDESPAEIVIRGKTYPAQVLSTRGLEVEVGIEHSCGQFIPEAILQTNLWYLLKLLRDKYVDYRSGSVKIDFSLSNALFSGEQSDVGLHNPEPQYSPSMPVPNEAQERAIRKSFSSRISVIWGPPGTGKTRTIAKAIEAHLNAGRRVLLVSHANNAVDEALEDVAEHLKTTSFYQDGKLIRLGKPQEEHLRILEDKYELVLIDKVAERLGESLAQERNELMLERESLEDVIDRTVEALNILQKVESTSSEVEAVKASILKLEKELAGTQDLLNRLEQNQSENRQRLYEAQSAGTFRRLFTGLNPEKIQRQIDQASIEIDSRKRQISEIDVRLREFRNSRIAKENELSTAKAEADTALSRINLNLGSSIVECPMCHAKNRVREQSANVRAICSRCRTPLPYPLWGYSVEELEKRKREYETQRDKILARIAEIERQLEEIRSRILSEAMLVATTLTKTYVAKTFPEKPFDVLIVDEASMAPLPHLYWAASRCRSLATIVGDFLQLPPICVAEDQPMAKKWLSKNIFTVLGINSVETADKDPRVMLLGTQYRMSPKISEIPKRLFYMNKLKDEVPDIRLDDGISTSPLVLVETAEMNPWCSRLSSGGRFNLYNALVCATLARKIVTEISKSEESIGIITPYVAQARLINKIAKDWDILKHVHVSNIHKFQGGEESIIIFDSVEGPGVRVAPMLDEKGKLPSDARLLLNVAVTRAKVRLYFVGHTEHLLSQLHRDCALAWIIRHFHDNAEVLSSETLVDDYLTDRFHDDFEEWTRRMLSTPASVREPVSGDLFTERSFWPQFIKDLKQVKKRLIILSPFISVRRAGGLIDFFQAMVRRGVEIRIYTRPPGQQSGVMGEQAGKVIERLNSMMVTVIQRNRMHQKVAIIDDDIAWEGSLNILSHRDTGEHMRRFQGKSAIEEIITNLELDEEWPVGMITDVTCRKHGKPMIVRMGKYGKFLGSQDYPKCKETLPLPTERK